MKKVYVAILASIALAGLVIGSASGKLPDSVFIGSIVGVIIVCAIVIANDIKPSTHTVDMVDQHLQSKRKYATSVITVIATAVLPVAMVWKMFIKYDQGIFFVLWLVAPIFLIGTAVTSHVIARRVYAHTKNDAEVTNRSVWLSMVLVALLIVIFVI